MKSLKFILISVATAALVGCSSPGTENGGNVSVNEPYVDDVGAPSHQGAASQAGVAAYNPTNAVVEPSGAGAPEGDR